MIPVDSVSQTDVLRFLADKTRTRASAIWW
jgi:hypothetical protein